MHTYTIKNGTTTPGLAVKNCWGVFLELDSQIDINREHPPAVIDGLILRASFSRKATRRRIARPHNVSVGQWEQWLTETPSVGFEPGAYHVLLAERSDDPEGAVLVMLEGGFRVDDAKPYPRASRYGNQWRVVELHQDMELILPDQSRIVNESGVPQLLTWRQYTVRQAKREGTPTGEAVHCVRLVHESRPSGVHQELVSGLAPTTGTLLGPAVVLGTNEQSEWLPLLGPLPADGAIRDAQLALIGERVLRSPEQVSEPDKRVRLHALALREPDPAAAWLVLVNRSGFRDTRRAAGSPDVLQSEDESTYWRTSRPDNEDIALLLHEGDAMSYCAWGRSSSGFPTHVLHVQAGRLLITPYLEWRAAHMEAHPELYQGPGRVSLSSCVTLTHLPVNWIGQRVEAVMQGDVLVTGELIAATTDHVLLRTEWGWGPRRSPGIVRLEPLWLAHKGMPVRRWTSEQQVAAFSKAGVRHALFQPRVTVEQLQATGAEDVEQMVAPVIILEVGTDPETAEPILRYGGPRLRLNGSNVWLDGNWFDTYDAADNARTQLVAALAGWISPELLEAIERLPEFTPYYGHSVIR